MRNNTIPQASRINSNIAKARNCFNNISMPKNFTKKAELTGIINRLAQVEKDVDGIIKYINQKTNDFEAAEKKAQAMAAGLNWSPSYQGGGISRGGYGGYGTLIIDPQKALEQMKNAGITINPRMYSTLLNLEIAASTLGFLKGKGEATQAYWSQSDIKSKIEKGDNISNLFKKGTIYSDIKGLWSAANTAFQFSTGTGGKIDNVFNSAWKRVMADSVMGGADVLIDTVTRVVVDKKNIQQAFRDAGGFETMGYKALTAGTMSSIGEFVRWRFGKTRNNKQNINNIEENNVYESSEYKRTSEFNFNEDRVAVVRKKHLEEIEQNVYSASDGRLMEIAKKTGNYGMDQDVTHELFYFVDSNGRQYRQKTKEFFEALENKKQLEIRFTPEYYKLEKYLTNSEYKMSKRDAMRTISMINTNYGMCELAATHDAISQVFASDPEKYTQATGLTISKSNVDDAQKLTDYFIYSNNEQSYHMFLDKPNGIFYDNKGKTEIMDNSNTTTFANGLSVNNFRNTNIGYNRFQAREINEYIQANGGKGEIEAKEFIDFSKTSKEDYVETMKKVQKYLEDDNKGIMLGLGKDIPLIIKKMENGMHYIGLNIILF
ncbi:MAG: hypothetical protein IJK18_03065 [Clostridia bacterium]|nr:hypothetical protein [Clostridia bacterium]